MLPESAVISRNSSPALVEELTVKIINDKTIKCRCSVFQRDRIIVRRVDQTGSKFIKSVRRNLPAREEVSGPSFRDVTKVRAKLESVRTLNPAKRIAIAGGPRLSELIIRHQIKAAKAGKWIHNVVGAIAESVQCAHAI